MALSKHADFNAVRAQSYTEAERAIIRALIDAHGSEYDSLNDLLADFADEIAEIHTEEATA